VIAVLGKRLPGGREAKIPSARFAAFAVGFVLIVPLVYLLARRFPVKSWVPLAVVAFGLLLLLLQYKKRRNP
jgi:hypothetical protein